MLLRNDSRRSAAVSPFMTHLFNILYYATPLVIALAVVEAVVLAFVRKQPYNWRASFASLIDAVTT